MTSTRSHRTLYVALAALLLAFGLAACGGGGGEGSGSTSAEAGGQAQPQGGSADAGSKQGGAKGGKGGEGEPEGPSGKGGEAAEFTPKPHNDSGGGSQQFRQRGGDNSVQEFGTEADPEEFDAAAAALHNFLDARAEGNWGAACEYMAKSVVESFEKLASQSGQINGQDCGAILGKLINPAAKKSMRAEAEKADVGSLRVEGDRSFVIYTSVSGTVLAMPMANEDGEWKVASLSGVPLS